MLNISKIFLYKPLSYTLKSVPRVNFCQMKTNHPDPIENEIQQAQRIKRDYIQEYQVRSRNVNSYKTTVAKLEEELSEIQQIKNNSDSPIKKVLNWMFNKESNQQKMIEKLKKVLENNKDVSSQLWRQTMGQKNYVTSLKHKLFGIQMIQAKNNLSKVDIQSFKNAKIKQGIELTFKMLNMIFVRNGFTQYKPAPKQKFNKDIHYEVDRIRTYQPKDTIVKVVQQGWMYNGQVLIPSKVIVSE